MKKKILVLGDIILDKYIHGKVEKISQESPTAIVNIDADDNDQIALGGAANVAANIFGLGGYAELCSLIGIDKNSIISKKILKKKKIKLIFHTEKKYKVTEKTRVISNGQQIIRLDKDSPKINYNQKLLMSKLKNQLNKTNFLIISDYNKGTIQDLKNIISIANKNKVKVLIDSKNENLKLYKNSYLVKPNQKEFEKIFNMKIEQQDTDKKVISLIKQLNITYLLLTMGKNGMKLFSKKGVKNFETNTKDVFDVTGAGDTVLATLAVGLNQKHNINDCVKYSLKAAEIAISKIGTTIVNIKQIEQKETKNKIQNILDLKKIVDAKRQNRDKIVFTNGCFDMLHSGHIHILKEAKKKGDLLIVGLNSDKSVKKNKGLNRPIINEKDRATHLSALEFVDYVVTYDEKTPESIIKKLNPNILVKGDEYLNKFIAGKQHVLKNKGKIILIEKYKDYSTSKFVNLKK